MSSSPCPCRDEFFEGSGVIRHAVADITPVDSVSQALYERWLAEGCQGGMDYLSRYPDIRTDPAQLLEGARSIVCCAIPYPNPNHLPPRKARIAAYALGDDYHEVVRERLTAVATRIEKAYGGYTRVCVDTAPLRERYWARKSGLGIIGLNNHLIIPGIGSCFFLGEILTTVRLEPTLPDLPADCGRCGRCVRACPTGALRPDGSVDARRCLSYLTIEHRGELPEGTDLHGCLYGCDICASVCPHNAGAAQAPVPEELMPRPALLNLTVEEAAQLTQEQFSALFRRSAIKRAKLAGLRRNALTLLQCTNHKSQFTIDR